MAAAGTSGLSRAELTDLFFIENRTRVLEIAAFLDRLDRAGGAGEDDFRLKAFRATLSVLAAGEGHYRTHQVQMILSDRNLEPLERLDQKNADGAARVSAEVQS